MEPAQSPRFSLSVLDWKKIGMGALVAMAAALATWLATWSVSIDVGPYTMLAQAVVAVLINLIRKFVSKNSGEPVPVPPKMEPVPPPAEMWPPG